MGLKEIKEQHKDLTFNLVDYVVKFDKSKTHKFTNFLTKMVKNEFFKPYSDERIIEEGLPDSKNIFEENIHYLIRSSLGKQNLEMLETFIDHLENDRIRKEKRDINLYNSWEEITQEVTLASMTLNDKKLEKEVIKLLETEEWVFVRPLTLEASLSYGAGTKWCTASRNNKSHFYRYAERGVLIYCINKKTGVKFGLFHSSKTNGSEPREFSIWNVVDDRIDTFQTNIPIDIMNEIYKISDVEKPNSFYFSDEEKLKSIAIFRREEEPHDLQLGWEVPSLFLSTTTGLTPVPIEEMYTAPIYTTDHYVDNVQISYVNEQGSYMSEDGTNLMNGTN